MKRLTMMSLLALFSAVGSAALACENTHNVNRNQATTTQAQRTAELRTAELVGGSQPAARTRSGQSGHSMI